MQQRSEIAPGALSTLLDDLTRVPRSELGGAWERTLQPGATVGPFELVREIGRGGFGVVWEAKDTRSGQSVAFKAMRATTLSAERGERLLREAEVAARLAHPNVVTLLDAGRSDSGPYLVLELLRGISLAERLGQGAMPVADALRVGIAIARAMAHAHAEGVVHRDLKPANVFLCDSGDVKVLDFGIAHAFGHRRIGGGTPQYMAPEQWRGAPEDERTDVFALGVILFRTLAGALPFTAESGSAAPGAYPAPTLEVEGTPALGELVAEMIAEDPVRRPRDGEAVLSRLTALAREQPSSGDEPPVVRVRPRPGVARGSATSAATPSDVRAQEYAQRGREFLRQTRRTSLRFAREMFARALAVDPNYPPALAGEAEAIALLKTYYPTDSADLEEADRASARAVELAPELAEVHTARGITLDILGRKDEGRRELARARELDPGSSEASFYDGRAAFQAGRFEEAAALFAQASRARESHEASFFRAQSLDALGRREEAIAAYEEGLALVEQHMDLRPDDSRAATFRAVALAHTGHFEEALRWAREALTLDPQDAGIRYNVACVHALAGRHSEALGYLAEIVLAGYSNREWMERDPDLASLHGLPGFESLLSEITRR